MQNDYAGNGKAITLLKQAQTRIRCAYCGLDHKVVIKVYRRPKDGEVLIAVEAGSEGCDVLDWNLVQ